MRCRMRRRVPLVVLLLARMSHSATESWVDSIGEAWKVLLEPEREPPECDVFPVREQPRRIFYSMMFGGYDLDQLEAVLFESSDLVHRYIVVEADATLQGDYRQRSLPAMLERGGRLQQYAGKLV